MKRRDYLQKIASASAGIIAGSTQNSIRISHALTTDGDKKTAGNPGESRVSLVTGTNRRDMTYEALKPFEMELKNALKNKNVLIKVNCVTHGRPLCATHPDAVRGALDFLKPICEGNIIIGESTVSPRGSLFALEEYGYGLLTTEYGVRLADLNEEPTTVQWILDSNLRPVPIRVINTFLNPDYFIISVARMKTHDCLFATLSLKNVVMGSPLLKREKNINDKVRMHATTEYTFNNRACMKLLNVNMFLLAQKVHPHFSVIDGVTGMEGNGPVGGDPVDHRVVLAGQDYVSVDRIGTELMGIPWENIGYLQYCANGGLGQGDRNKIKIIGAYPKDHVIRYKLHQNIEWQHTWKDDIMIKKGD
ncbi:DUF362 domain-containing protein [Candidatus Latescibacterota bacterium]